MTPGCSRSHCRANAPPIFKWSPTRRATSTYARACGMLTTRLVEGAPSTGATLTLTSILPRWTAAWMIRRASSSSADRARGSLRAMSRWRWLSDLHSTERLRRGLAISARPYPVMLRIIEASDWLRQGREAPIPLMEGSSKILYGQGVWHQKTARLFVGAAGIRQRGRRGPGRSPGPGGKVRVSRPHEQHRVTLPCLARDPAYDRVMILGIPAAQLGWKIIGQHLARDVARDGPAAVEDLRVAEAILGAEQTGDEGAELRAEESRRAKAVRLEDGDHAVGARLRRGERRPDLLPVVSVVIDHANAAGRDADDLKSPGHPRKARQGGPDRRGGHAQLE